MNFEKLKEMMFYFLIGLGISGLLVAAWVGFQSFRSGSNAITSIQNAFVNTNMRSDKYKKSHTIDDALTPVLTGKSLGNYSIDVPTGIIFANNVDGEDGIEGDGSLTINGVTLPTQDSKINVYLIPDKKIGTIFDNQDATYLLATGAKEMSGTDNKLTSGLQTAFKGYVTNLYVGYGAFKDEDVAKTFMKSFVPQGDVIKVTDGSSTPKYLVVTTLSKSE